MDRQIIIKPRIYVTELIDTAQQYVVPDGVIHKFRRQSPKKTKKTSSMKPNEKLEKVIEFKRSFISITYKDSSIYTKIAKSMDIIFLRGKAKPLEINGCMICFYNIKEILASLASKKNVVNKDFLNSLTKQIYTILKVKDVKNQKELDNN